MSILKKSCKKIRNCHVTLHIFVSTNFTHHFLNLAVMNTQAYFSDGLHNKYRKQIIGISYWNGKNWMQCSDATIDLIKKLAANMEHDESFVIKTTGEVVVSSNPLYIYGENTIDLIMVNGVEAYNKFTKSAHVAKITNDYLFHQYK